MKRKLDATMKALANKRVILTRTTPRNARACVRAASSAAGLTKKAKLLRLAGARYHRIQKHAEQDRKTMRRFSDCLGSKKVLQAQVVAAREDYKKLKKKVVPMRKKLREALAEASRLEVEGRKLIEQMRQESEKHAEEMRQQLADPKGPSWLQQMRKDLRQRNKPYPPRCILLASKLM